MASVASEICPVRGVRLSCGRHAVQFKMLPQTTRRRQLQARVRQRIPIGARPEIHNSSRSRPRTAHAKGGGVALGRDGRSWSARAPVDIQ
jgi:hypothetical protein